MAKSNKKSYRSASKSLGHAVKRASVSGRFISVKTASNGSRKVIKDSAKRHGAALVRLADR